jgi:hypothetical protein
MTHFHLASATGAAAPSIQWIERELGDAWRHLRGQRATPQREVRPATELCGELAEFGGMLGEEED